MTTARQLWLKASSGLSVKSAVLASRDCKGLGKDKVG